MSQGKAFVTGLCVRPSKTEISLWIPAVWLESSQSTPWATKYPRRLQMDSGHAQADLSLGARAFYLSIYLSLYLSTSIRPSISWWPPSSAEHRNGNPRVSGSSSCIFLTLWHLVADVADWEIRRISTTEGKLWQRRPDSSAEHRNSNRKAPRYCCTFCSHSYIWWPEWIQAPSGSLKEYENKPAWRRLRDSGWIRRNVTVTTGYFSR